MGVVLCFPGIKAGGVESVKVQNISKLVFQRLLRQSLPKGTAVPAV